MEWSECSQSCGGGFQERNRVCLGCSSKQRRSCNLETCYGNLLLGSGFNLNLLIPTDYFTQWSKWSTCSKTCSTGSKLRNRSCKDPNNCKTDSFELRLEDFKSCRLGPCQTFWSNWLAWEPCSTTCGPGKTFRSRKCELKDPEDTPCEGDLDAESKSCELEVCVGKWTKWKAVAPCPVTCGTAVVDEFRTCEGGKVGGPGCKGDEVRTVDCSLPKCVIAWSTWSTWTKCDKKCNGGNQLRIRFYHNYLLQFRKLHYCFRVCENGKPGDIGCPGNETENRACNTEACTEGILFVQFLTNDLINQFILSEICRRCLRWVD